MYLGLKDRGYCQQEKEGEAVIEDLIKAEMTPKTVTLWGQPHHNHTPVLINQVHGDGKCLIYIVPLATLPNYYILRVDSTVRKMIEDDEDEIRDLVDQELLNMIEDEVGPHEWEDDDGNEHLDPWPALDESCGHGWGEIL